MGKGGNVTFSQIILEEFKFEKKSLFIKMKNISGSKELQKELKERMIHTTTNGCRQKVLLQLASKSQQQWTFVVRT